MSLSVVLLSYVNWEWAPLIEGASPRPPWQIVLAKAAGKFLAVIASGVVVYRLALTSLQTWPVLDTSLDTTGLKDFAAAIGQDTRIQIAGLCVLFALLYWRTNTVTRPEYVRPDGTPVAGTHYITRTHETPRSKSYAGSGSSGRWFWKTIIVFLLLGSALIVIARSNLIALSDHRRWPIQFSYEAPVPSAAPPARSQSPMQWSPGTEYMPVSRLIYNRPDSFIQELSREGYQLDATAARVALPIWTRIYPPDDIATAVDIIPVSFDNDHVFVADCTNPQLIRDTNVWVIAKQLELFPTVPVLTTDCRPFYAAGSGLIYFYARFRR